MVPWTWWPHDEVGHTDEARKEIQSIFGTQTAFDTPKPVRLIERILRIATNPGDLVLDFFAGSGTTAHAVLKLNAEDGGDRRFILVSSTEATADAPDKNLCREVCAERVRRAMRGYRNRKGEEVAGLGGAFAYLRTRRLAAGALLTIDHAPVWNALQLLHLGHLTPYRPDEPLQRAASDAGLLLYLPKVSETAIDALRQCLDAAPCLATVYSWQVALLRQRVADERATFEPLPRCLAARFGSGGTP